MNTPGNKPFSRFLLVWSGQFVSSIGSGLTAFSLGIYAWEKTQSATVWSLIILFAFLPSYLLKPFGGTMADRFDRRFLIISGDIGSALGVVFILLLMVTGYDQMWGIYTGVAISSAFVALHNPAYKASVTDLVDEKMYAKASGLIQLAETSKFLISPILAAFLLGFLNIRQVLIIDIATFLAATIAVAAIRKDIICQNRSSARRFFSDFAVGFRYTFSDSQLIRLLFLISLVTFAVGFMQALMGPMILAFSNTGTLATIQTISATGMIVSSIIIGVFSKTTDQKKILSVSLALAGVFYALFGTSTNVAFITSIGFLFFATLPFINTALEVLIRTRVENEMQGRVWSIVSVISQLGMVFALCTAGYLADHLFNPLLTDGGILASTAGKIVGAGAGRGIGLMFFLSGLSVIVAASVVRRVISFEIVPLKKYKTTVAV